MRFDALEPVILDVAGDDAGERAAQIHCQFMCREIAAQRQGRHGLVRRIERRLERRIDPQQPVVVPRVLVLAPLRTHALHAARHLARDDVGLIDHDAIARLRRRAERRADEGIDLLEVRGALRRAGEHHRQLDARVVLVQQHAEQVEDFLGGACPARKHDDAMADPHEGLQALFDVRQHHQLIGDRIGRFGGDDSGLGEADVAPAGEALLGVADRRALHRPLHGTGSAAGAHVQSTQTEFIADLLGVVVLGAADRVAAPAHHQIGAHPRLQQPGIAQDVEHRIGDVSRAGEIEARTGDLGADVDHVAQHREQMFLHALDHLAVDERTRRRVLDVELQSPRTLHDAHVEVGVLLHHLQRIVGECAAIEDRQRATTKQRIQSAAAGIEQLLRFLLREDFETAARGDAGGDAFAGQAHSRYVVRVAPSSCTKIASSSAGSVTLTFSESVCTAPSGSKNVSPGLNVPIGPLSICERIVPFRI